MLNKTYRGYIDDVPAIIELNQPTENQILVNGVWYTVKKDSIGRRYFVKHDSEICFFRIDEGHSAGTSIAPNSEDNYTASSGFAPAINDNSSFDTSGPSFDYSSLNSGNSDSGLSFDGFGGGDFGGGGSSDSW